MVMGFKRALITTLIIIAASLTLYVFNPLLHGVEVVGVSHEAVKVEGGYLKFQSRMVIHNPSLLPVLIKRVEYRYYRADEVIGYGVCGEPVWLMPGASLTIQASSELNLSPTLKALLLHIREKGESDFEVRGFLFLDLVVAEYGYPFTLRGYGVLPLGFD